MSNILIIGANRGLGLEFTKQYSELGHHVFATTRDKSKSSKSSKSCIIEIIRYRTLCNQIIGWIKNNLIKQHKKE